MMIVPGSLGRLGAIASAIAQWLPSGLFTTGVNGAWYDPSDITRYMSSLGPELVTNGDFSNGTTGWTLSANASVTGSALVVTSAPQFEYFARSTPGFGTVGNYYSFTFTISNYSGGQVGLYFYNDTEHRFSSNGTYTVVMRKNDAGGIRLRSMSTTAFSATIDNISVRELTGISTATLFQDAAGTTPVTAVEQPVGLMLDKSKGLVLGPELVAPINFTSGWASSGATVTFDSASTFTSSGVANIFRAYFTIGSWYKMVFKATFTGGIALYNSNTATNPIGPSSVVSGTEYTFYFFAAATQLNIRTTSASIVTVSNISVRELPGNHAFNPSGNSANFPVLSARYNLLTKTEQFDDAVWTKVNASVTSDTAVSPSGTLTADKLVESAATGGHVIRQSGTASTVSTSITIYAKAGERQYLQLGAGVTTQQYANFDLVNGSIAAVGSEATATMVGVGNGWYRCSIAVGSISSGTALFIGVVNSSSADWQQSYTGNGTSGIYIWGADLRVANDALNQPAYQRVDTATDYDTVGFKPYLSFNGVNQWLQTNSIDLTYGDKMFVCAGARYLTASTTMFAELSAIANSNAGSFYITLNESATGLITYRVHGTAFGGGTVPPSPVAPNSSVLSLSMDSRSGSAIPFVSRINAIAQTATTAGGSGAGNFGNYPLYIGARAGTSLFFNGRLYGLVVAGKQASASEIASTEAWLNQETGAY